MSIFGPIEQGIPLPPAGGRPVTGGKYDWRRLEQVGDSVLIACEPKQLPNIRANLSTWRARQANSPSFATRPVDGGLRVWRTA